MFPFTIFLRLSFLALLILLSLPAYTKPLCLYVSSYHRGYQWNDAIEEGLSSTLAGACDDNASKYLIIKHLKGTDIPTIFCGVNGTVQATANRRWKILVNPALAQQVAIKLPEHLLQNAIIIKSPRK